MAKFTKLATEVAKIYDGKFKGNVIKFDSEDDLFKAADEIGNDFAFTVDQDDLTIEFLNENIDIKFITSIGSAMGIESFTNESVTKLTKTIGLELNESEVTTVTGLLNAKRNKDVDTVASDPMQVIADTVNQSTTLGASLEIVDTEDSKNILIRVGDQIITALPTEVIKLDESTFVNYGTNQLNESQYNALVALGDCESKKRFLTSMAINDLDAESIAKNLELLKPTHPDMDENGLLPINESKSDDIYNLQSKLALHCKQSGLGSSELQKALLLVNMEAKKSSPNFNSLISIRDSMMFESTDASKFDEMYEIISKTYNEMVADDENAKQLTEFLNSFDGNTKVPEDGIVGKSLGELSADLQEGITKFMEERGFFTNESIDVNEDIEGAYKFDNAKDIEVAAASKGYVAKAHSGQSKVSNVWRFDIVKEGKKMAIGVYDKTKKIAVIDVNKGVDVKSLLEGKMLNESDTWDIVKFMDGNKLWSHLKEIDSTIDVNIKDNSADYIKTKAASFLLRNFKNSKETIDHIKVKLPFVNEAVTPNSADTIAFEILKLYGNFKDAPKVSRNAVKQALRNVIETKEVANEWLTNETKFLSIFNAIDTMREDFGGELINEAKTGIKVQAKRGKNWEEATVTDGTPRSGKIEVKFADGKFADVKLEGQVKFANESIPQIESRIENTKSRIGDIKGEAKSAASVAATKVRLERAKLSSAKAQLKAAKKSKSLNESNQAPQGVGGNVIVVPNSSFQNPWLTHKLETEPSMRGYKFGNQFNSDIVNADVMVDRFVDRETGLDYDMIEGQDYPVEKAELIVTPTPVSIYINENNELAYYNTPIPNSVSVNGRISSPEEFINYANYIINGVDNEINQQVTEEDAVFINSLIYEYDKNYGVMLGKLDDYLSLRTTT